MTRAEPAIVAGPDVQAARPSLVPPGRTRRAILCGGILCGILDISAAFVLSWALARVGPVRVLQGIAEALVGPASAQGGAATAALGLLMHFGVAFYWAAVFAVLARRVRLPARSIVMPDSARTSSKPSAKVCDADLANGLSSHASGRSAGPASERGGVRGALTPQSRPSSPYIPMSLTRTSGRNRRIAESGKQPGSAAGCTDRAIAVPIVRDAAPHLAAEDDGGLMPPTPPARGRTRVRPRRAPVFPSAPWQRTASPSWVRPRAWSTRT